MASRRKELFTAIRTEGAILPPDILQRIADRDPELEGIGEAAYHLSDKRLGEAITQSWNSLQGAWTQFSAHRAQAPESDLGTSLSRERFLLPLFQELGFGRLQPAKELAAEGKQYAISHLWQSVPIHLLGFRISLDRRSKGVAGAASQSPHGLVQEFLNRSQDNLYGFVANGMVLRLLRDNTSLTRQAYVEFDLETIFDGQIYADFALLWLVCHQSRFEGTPPSACLLESWSQTAANQGTRVLERLREGVSQALGALGSGFLAHPANTSLREDLRSGALSTHDYYRQLLRVVYRLIFLFVAEDRGLLHRPEADRAAVTRYAEHYSTARLRWFAGERRGGRYSDLWEQLRLVMDLCHDGCEPIAIPPLGSFLWSKEACPDLSNAQLHNAALTEAIRVLAFTREREGLRPVDYKNLGSEELGSVYESLLEMHPEMNIDAATFHLDTAPGHERKTTGSYYTPSSLVQALCDSALEPVLDQAIKASDPEAAILELKVCDPATGSGHFLVAAAHRIAKRLAAVRTSDSEPSPEAVRAAVRDVIGSCIYGVDVNAMAVELCKVSLWMEALDPGKPLSFLDAHIKKGNSLIGATPDLIANGIPDDAFSPITGDDKNHATRLKKRNRDQRKMEQIGNIQLAIAESPLATPARALADSARKLEALSDDAPEDIVAKERAHAELLASDPYIQGKLVADVWCAAFYQTKTKEGPLQITQEIVRLLSETPSAISAVERDAISAIARENGFFHWNLEFPAVFANGAKQRGFDVVLGNPPWEQTQLSEKEFFAARAPDIAAKAGATRKKAIARLATDDPPLYEEFQSALRRAEAESHFLRHSARYPLCGTGKINSYAVFAEAMRYLIAGHGRVGCIVPTGIATDDTTKNFFADCVDSKALASLFDFENRKGIFHGVHRSFKFCLMTLTGPSRPEDAAEFLFFAHGVSDLADTERRFTLSPGDFALLNPNTRTCPIFRSRRDAEITKEIYRRVPVLVDESKGAAGNRWGVSFRQGLFNMTGDSGLFRTRSQLETDGWTLDGNIFRKGDSEYLPLHEAKMVHHFDHRFGDFSMAPPASKDTSLPDVPGDKLIDPEYAPLPRYWVSGTEVSTRLAGKWDRDWLLCWRNVARSTDERTVIAATIPRVAVGHSAPLILSDQSPQALPCLLANLTSYVLDYVCRQKIGGINLTFFIMQQLPILPATRFDNPAPWEVDQTLRSWMTSRVLELSYTGWDLQLFAQDLGYDGPPFRWDPERRFLLRCELDAAFFHLYGITAEDADHILDTFPIVKRRDETAHGEYRTKKTILEIYDAVAKAMASREPYATVLDPPPADLSIAHPSREAAALPPAARALRLVESPQDQDKHTKVVPILDLKAAAGRFGDAQAVEELGWVEAPGHKVRKGMFVAQVVGHSMEPRIPSGSWCLFAHPAGSNQGKIVLAQHREIYDPETGGSYTVKVYRSEKKYHDDGTWEHTEVRLEPINREYSPIFIKEVEEGELELIAELVEVYPSVVRMQEEFAETSGRNMETR
jgi:phage repressor protein C with HTH and peptisase S24 domain